MPWPNEPSADSTGDPAASNGHATLKILYLCPDLGIPVLGRKGASVHVRGLVNAFRRAGHKVVVAAQLLSKSFWEEPALLEVPLIELKPTTASLAAVAAIKEIEHHLGLETSLPGEIRRVLFNREVGLDLKRKFQNDPPDFIYERASLHGTAGTILAAELRVPLLLELNAPLALEQSAYRGLTLQPLAVEAERLACTGADAVLTVSAALREHVRSFGVAPARVHVFPNGVDATLFRPGPRDPNLRARFGLANGPVIGFVGGLRPWHGVELLPELLRRLAEHQADVRLVVVGDGPLRSTVQGRLHELGLAHRSVFTGSLPHSAVPPLLREFDVAVAPYPSPDHDFYFSPLKLFEYMACGVPVVAARLGQIAEIVRHGQTGLLCPPGDLPALAAACEHLLTDQALRNGMGEAAAREVQTRFTWDHNARRAIALARGLIAERQAASAEPTLEPTL
ncbi:MAG: glycosyltransferase family 4 protein [Verrucomicrobia bacterium]|nr:glycosyltransferase family 4 protein [Verrucomicrobiota bacterium]